ncbi:VCP-like ATPase [uncultured archaeon]|nr:VCP-like ATPase [uncultured archaeon]
MFVDEIDALVPARDVGSESGNQLTGEFLQEFDKLKDTVGIVVVASTNRPDVIDTALLRPGRFDRLIYIPPPEEGARAKIFALNLKKVPLAEDVDAARLAALTEGFTGADISNICRQAKLNALEASLAKGGDAKLEMADLTRIIQHSKPSAPSNVMGRYMAFFGKYGKR